MNCSIMRPSTPSPDFHTQQYFQEFLEREWRRASRERQNVTVIMIEVDHFRAFNDRQGKPEGDAFLQKVAEALKPIIHRPSDVIARYGGPGKFGVVLGATDCKGAMLLAERLRVAVENMKLPNPASPTGPFVTASLGVAVAMPDRQGEWQDIELIASAERALAQAREAGRNTVTLGYTGLDGPLVGTSFAPLRSMFLYFEKDLRWTDLARRTVKDSIQDATRLASLHSSPTISSCLCSPHCCSLSRWPASSRSTVSRTS